MEKSALTPKRKWCLPGRRRKKIDSGHIGGNMIEKLKMVNHHDPDLLTIIVMYVCLLLSKMGTDSLASMGNVDVNEVVHDVSQAIISIAGVAVLGLSVLKIYVTTKKNIRKSKHDKERDAAVDKMLEEFEEMKKKGS